MSMHVLGRGLSSERDGWGMIVFLLRLEHQEKSFFVDNFIWMAKFSFTPSGLQGRKT